MKHFGAHRNANKLGDIEFVCYEVLKEFLFFCKEMINYPKLSLLIRVLQFRKRFTIQTQLGHF